MRLEHDGPNADCRCEMHQASLLLPANELCHSCESQHPLPPAYSDEGPKLWLLPLHPGTA